MYISVNRRRESTTVLKRKPSCGCSLVLSIFCQQKQQQQLFQSSSAALKQVNNLLKSTTSISTPAISELGKTNLVGVGVVCFFLCWLWPVGFPF
uniref:Uncharacterized protein n=1 Tax=Nelumbo nucifera TaxID=4432 RepID=A0A822YGW6_NELNU|nr:TPA_asm: hypothetical protein HUJ06_009562 [Nelumbo nucifera]